MSRKRTLLPAILPMTQTACSRTLSSGDWRSDNNMGIAPASITCTSQRRDRRFSSRRRVNISNINHPTALPVAHALRRVSKLLPGTTLPHTVQNKQSRPIKIIILVLVAHLQVHAELIIYQPNPSPTLFTCSNNQIRFYILGVWALVCAVKMPQILG